MKFFKKSQKETSRNIFIILILFLTIVIILIGYYILVVRDDESFDAVNNVGVVDSNNMPEIDNKDNEKQEQEPFINVPNLNSLVRSHNGAYNIYGSTSPNCSKITVSAINKEAGIRDIYELKSYKLGDTSFKYGIREDWNNLAHGENLYIFQAFCESNKVVEIRRIFDNKDQSIWGTTDISDFSSAVGLISCQQSVGLSFGSGFLMDFGLKSNTGARYNILTNKHVIGDADECWFEPELKINGEQSRIYFENLNYYAYLSPNSDFAIIPISEFLPNYEMLKIDSWNWIIAYLPNCSPEIKLGSKVYTIGYPATGNTQDYYTDNEENSYRITNMHQIITDGIVSGYVDDGYNSVLKKNVPNFFISNNIDSGNSGGAAIAIEEGRFCMLGMPTWVNSGDHQNLGIVLNFYNFFK